MSIGMKTVIVAFMFLLGMSIMTVPSIEKLGALTRKREVGIGSQFIIAEVVTTPEEEARGLGGRDALGVNEGMLFTFAEPGVYPFWMKDMRFPIDIIWLRDRRIVGITERIDPQIGAPERELRLYAPQEPVTEVLELAAGRARMLQAEVGDAVTVRPLVP